MYHNAMFLTVFTAFVSIAASNASSDTMAFQRIMWCLSVILFLLLAKIISLRIDEIVTAALSGDTSLEADIFMAESGFQINAPSRSSPLNRL